MTKYLILLVFSFSLMSADLVTVNRDLKKAKLIVLGEVVGKDNNIYLIKLDKWISNTVKETNFIKIDSEKKLTKFNKYLFSLNSVEDSELFVLTDPSRDVYEVKSMGEYEFLIRDYNSDKPLVGQVGLLNTLDYIKKNLNLKIATRSISKFERGQVENVTQNSRKLASIGLVSASEASKLSEAWILSFFGVLVLIPFILRKTNF